MGGGGESPLFPALNNKVKIFCKLSINLRNENWLKELGNQNMKLIQTCYAASDNLRWHFLLEVLGNRCIICTFQSNGVCKNKT